MRAWLRRQKHALKPDVPCVHHRRQYSMGQGVHPNLSMASKPTAGQCVSVCVCQFSLCCKKHMHACTTVQETKKAHILQILEQRQMLPLTSMVKRHLAMACSQLARIVRLPTLFPTLVALLPALAHTAVLARTHWHMRVPALCNCGAKHVSQPIC